MSQDRARREARREVEAMGGRGEFAKKAKVDPGTLGDFLDGVRWPQAPTRTKIEKALGWPTGRIVDIAEGIDGSDETGVPAAIRNDTRLLPEAREHLLNQYQLLLRLNSPTSEAQLQAEMRADIEATEISEQEGTKRSGAKRR